MALGTEAAVVASASAALTGADSIMAQAAANAVNVANFGDLVVKLLERIDCLMAFIKIVTLFFRYLANGGQLVMSVMQNRTNFLYPSKLSSTLSVVGLLIVNSNQVKRYH
jgi:hypothetical protein